MRDGRMVAHCKVLLRFDDRERAGARVEEREGDREGSTYPTNRTTELGKSFERTFSEADAREPAFLRPFMVPVKKPPTQVQVAATSPEKWGGLGNGLESSQSFRTPRRFSPVLDDSGKIPRFCETSQGRLVPGVVARSSSHHHTPTTMHAKALATPLSSIVSQ